MSLDKLPAELYGEILRLLQPKDISRLNRTSKRLYYSTKSIFWNSVCFLSDNGKVLSQINHGFPTGEDGVGFSLCRTLTIASPMPHRTACTTEKNACLACLPIPLPLDPSSSTQEPDTRWIHEQLNRLAPGTLRSFQWLLGVCLPPLILGYYGGALRRQNNLEEIVLVTCFDRLGIRCIARHVLLDCFPRLRKLTWIGIHVSQLFALHDALWIASPRLTHLELDFLSHRPHGWLVPEPQESLPNILAQRRLAPKDPEPPSMPKLASLSLTNAEVDYRSLAQYLNLWHLRTLKLRCCTGWDRVLQSVCDSCVKGERPALGLRHLELHHMQPSLHHAQPYTQQQQQPGDDEDDYTTVTELIPWCPDLEQLALYVLPRRDEATDATATWLHHLLPVLEPSQCPNLRSFVCHVEPREGHRHEGTVDDMPDYKSFFEMRVPALGVEFLGLYGAPNFVWPFLESCHNHGSLNNLSVFHVRRYHDRSHSQGSPLARMSAPESQSPQPGHTKLRRQLGRELWDMVQWLFDDRVFPSLRVVAIGDMASIDRGRRLLLCRDNGTVRDVGQPEPEPEPERMRYLREDDHDLLALLERHMDALMVGPNYSRYYMRPSGASLGVNVWRRTLSMRLARESALP